MNEVQNTRLISILKTLTSREWKQLRLFIEASSGKSMSKSLILYDLLAKYHPDFKDPELTRQVLFKALFGAGTFDDKKLRYVMSDLNELAVKFLGVSVLERNQSERLALVKEELAKRAADKAYLSFYPNDEFTWLMDAAGDSGVYFNRYRDAYLHLSHFMPRQKRTADNPIGAAARNLDLFYITRKLQLLCEMVNIRNVMAVEYDSLLEKEIISMIRSGFFRDVPVIEIYYGVFMTLTEPDTEEHFNNLRILLPRHHHIFRRDELRDLYQYLMNYCIKKINQGNTSYVQRLFEIYQGLLPGRIIFTGDFLSQWDFKNIVTIGLRCQANSWVNQFMESYAEHLPPADRHNALLYNRAYFFYATGDYKKALAALQEVEFTDLYYQLDSRAILLKCFYEIDDEDALFYHIGAFRLFLARNKTISDYQRITYSNLVRFTSALTRSAGSRKKISELIAKMNSVKQIADRGWLSRMATEKMLVVKA